MAEDFFRLFSDVFTFPKGECVTDSLDELAGIYFSFWHILGSPEYFCFWYTCFDGFILNAVYQVDHPFEGFPPLTKCCFREVPFGVIREEVLYNE